MEDVGACGHQCGIVLLQKFVICLNSALFCLVLSFCLGCICSWLLCDSCSNSVVQFACDRYSQQLIVATVAVYDGCWYPPLN